MQWPLTFYTNNFPVRHGFRFIMEPMPEWVGGRAWLGMIFIRPRYKDDVGIYRHELNHVKWFFLTFGLMPILTKFRRFRLFFETNAYKEQMRWLDKNSHNLTLDEAAFRLADPPTDHYDFGISVEEAKQLLQE